MKLKIKKKITKLDLIDTKIDNFVNILISSIIFLIPVIFLLYVINVHGFLFPYINGEPLFRLDRYYRYFMYLLGLGYFYKLFRKKNSITLSDIFVFLFGLFTIISTIFAHNRQIALFGYPNRFEGMFTILFYIFLYLDCKLYLKEKDINYFYKSILSISFVHLFFVFLQLSGIYKEIFFLYHTGSAIGLTENCNFLGSLMCLLGISALTTYMLTNKKEDIYYLMVFIASYITLLLANSTGPFISYIFTFFLLIIYLFIKKNFILKKFIISLLIIVILYPICLLNRDNITPEIKSHFTFIYKEIVKKPKRTTTTDNDKNLDLEIRNLGHGRIRIWSNTYQLIKEKPLLGYGPDNLGLVYQMTKDDSKIADKAHNIYLHIWVSSGLFSLLSYILWISLSIIASLKRNNALIIALCFGIICYSVQGTFNINVIEVTPYFYIFMGLMMSLVKEKTIKIENKK